VPIAVLEKFDAANEAVRKVGTAELKYVVRGTSEQVRSIADGLLGTKGVKHGKLVSTTTGKGL
jgi:hypothetical protein